MTSQSRQVYRAGTLAVMASLLSACMGSTGSGPTFPETSRVAIAGEVAGSATAQEGAASVARSPATVVPTEAPSQPGPQGAITQSSNGMALRADGSVRVSFGGISREVSVPELWDFGYDDEMDELFLLGADDNGAIGIAMSSRALDTTARDGIDMLVLVYPPEGGYSRSLPIAFDDVVTWADLERAGSYGSSVAGSLAGRRLELRLSMPRPETIVMQTTSPDGDGIDLVIEGIDVRSFGEGLPQEIDIEFTGRDGAALLEGSIALRPWGIDGQA